MAEIYILAGGGTGGHLLPGVAVAEALVERDASAKVVFACSNRAIDRRILDELPYGVVPQPVRPLPRSAARLPGFLRAWRRSKELARDLVGDLKPAGVLGLGGFAAAPVVKQAARAGVRTALLNPDAVAGKANRYLARRVDAVFTQFELTRGLVAGSIAAKTRCVGCPMRKGVLSGSRAEALRFFDLRDDRRTLLVLGGSQGAGTINDAVRALRRDLEAMAERWQVLHVTGPGKDAPRGPEGRGELRIRNVDYCDRMDLAYAAADLALCRAGASTVAELSATATPAVFMPYPYHRDRQQRLNAEQSALREAAVIGHDWIDSATNAAMLLEVLFPLLRFPERVDAMCRAAAGLGRTEAAGRVADYLSAC